MEVEKQVYSLIHSCTVVETNSPPILNGSKMTRGGTTSLGAQQCQFQSFKVYLSVCDVLGTLLVTGDTHNDKTGCFPSSSSQSSSGQHSCDL